MRGRILITGGGGFVGSRAARHFASRGWEVVAFDNLSRETLLGGQRGPIPMRYNWDRLRQEDGISLVRGDVRRIEDLKASVREADAIVHAAAQVAVTKSLEDPRTDLEVNLLGTFNVLEAARLSRTNPQILFCSTNKVYGNNVNSIPVREEESRYSYADLAYVNGIPPDFPVDAPEHTPYGVSKLAADGYVREYAHTYGLKTVTFRMSCIYGEGQSGNEDQGWVAHFVISMLRDAPLTIFGDGKQVRDVLHVADLVRAFESAFLCNEALRGGVFNIGGGPNHALSLLELIRIVRALTGKEASLSFTDWRPGDQKVYISDVSRAEKVLGWTPQIEPREGLERLVRWYTSGFLA